MLGQDAQFRSLASTSVFQLRMAFMWIYPNLIQPLFNEFKSLQDASLKEKIEALAAEAIRRIQNARVLKRGSKKILGFLQGNSFSKILVVDA